MPGIFGEPLPHEVAIAVFNSAPRPFGRPGAGPGGTCRCPSCGYEIEHERGEACILTPCPKCQEQGLLNYMMRID